MLINEGCYNAGSFLISWSFRGPESRYRVQSFPECIPFESAGLGRVNAGLAQLFSI